MAPVVPPFVLWIVESLALTTTIYLFLSPMDIIKRAREANSTAAFSPFPFILMLMNGMNWIVYGIIAPSPVVWGVNAIGFVISLYLCGAFFKYTTEEKGMKIFVIASGVGVGFQTALYGHLAFNIREHDEAYKVMSVYGTAIAIVALGSPLVKAFHVVKTRDPSCMSFPLALATAVCGGLWVLFGIITMDKVVVLNNTISGSFGLLQITLFALFGPQYLKPANWFKGPPPKEPAPAEVTL